jgi:hypothetical protein
MWVDIAFDDLRCVEKIAKAYNKDHKHLIRTRHRLDVEKNDICKTCLMPSPSMCNGCGIVLGFRDKVSAYFETMDGEMKCGLSEGNSKKYM